jgi:hypothetical protein
LSHLFLDDSFDLQRIVDVQVQLKVFGVFWSKDLIATLTLVSHLNGRSLCVVGLNRGGGYTDYYTSISLHPSLLDMEHARDFCTILRQSEEVVASRFGLELDCAEVENAVIFVKTPPPLGVLDALMLSMSEFPQLSDVYVYVKPGLVRRLTTRYAFEADILLAEGLEMGAHEGGCPSLCS